VLEVLTGADDFGDLLLAEDGGQLLGFFTHAVIDEQFFFGHVV